MPCIKNIKKNSVDRSITVAINHPGPSHEVDFEEFDKGISLGKKRL